VDGLSAFEDAEHLPSRLALDTAGQDRIEVGAVLPLFLRKQSFSSAEFRALGA
jgi:hypothetical protein